MKSESPCRDCPHWEECFAPCQEWKDWFAAEWQEIQAAGRATNVIRRNCTSDERASIPGNGTENRTEPGEGAENGSGNAL